MPQYRNILPPPDVHADIAQGRRRIGLLALIGEGQLLGVYKQFGF